MLDWSFCSFYQDWDKESTPMVPKGKEPKLGFSTTKVLYEYSLIMAVLIFYSQQIFLNIHSTMLN